MIFKAISFPVGISWRAKLFFVVFFFGFYAPICFSVPSAEHAVVAFEEMSRLRTKLKNGSLTKTEQERLAQLLFLHSDCQELVAFLRKEAPLVSGSWRSQWLCACGEECTRGVAGWTLFRLHGLSQKLSLDQSDVAEARALMSQRPSGSAAALGIEAKYLFARILLSAPNQADRISGKKIMDEVKKYGSK